MSERRSAAGVVALAAALATLLSALGGLVSTAALFGALPIGLGAPIVLALVGSAGLLAALTAVVAAVLALRTPPGRTLALIALALVALAVLAWAALGALAWMAFVLFDPAG